MWRETEASCPQPTSACQSWKWVFESWPSPQVCRLQTGGMGQDCQSCSRTQETALASVRGTVSCVPGKVRFQDSQGLLRIPLQHMGMVLMGGVFWLFVHHNSYSVASSATVAPILHNCRFQGYMLPRVF